MVVRFRYTPGNLSTLSTIEGGEFLPNYKGEPAFKFFLDVTNCKRLRKACGNALEFSEDILEWGRQRKAESERLINLANARDLQGEDLLRVQEFMPEMYAKLRPYQKAGIRFISSAPHPLVADDPGLGKTWQVIGGVYEARMDSGPNIVVCPKLSIENVWLKELGRFQEHAVFVAPEGKKQREKLLEEVEFALEEDLPFWLVVNPATLTYRRGADGEGYYDTATKAYYDCQFPFITKTKWNCIILDEAHESGIANPGTQTAKAIAALNVKKRIAMTGTPAGGKARRLWGILHWLEPKEFKAKGRWSEQWMDTVTIPDPSDPLGIREIKKFGGIKPEHEAEFYRAHAQYILRRTKKEVAPELPDKIRITVKVDMLPEQKKQYEQMESEAEVAISELEAAGKVTAMNVLATFSWLKQFANAYCDLVVKKEVWDDIADAWVPKYKAIPTEKSPKLDAVMQILDDLGIPDGDEQCLIFTQFSGMADMVTKYLIDRGIPTAKITGKVNSRQKRREIVDDFQAGGAKVVVMTTKAGGVSVTLDNANTVIFLDETWDPDHRTQAEDRAHRISRIHQVTVYTIQTKSSIETGLIARTLREKTQINDILLDTYRKKELSEQEQE